MKLHALIEGRSYDVDLGRPIPISIPLDFGASQPSTYSVPPAASRAYEDGAFIGDTRRGGSCNFETVTITPHCNGTHTECVGHITNERIFVNDRLRDVLLPAAVISVRTADAGATPEHCEPAAVTPDLLITSAAIAAASAGIPRGFLRALIVRTLPNDAGKKNRNYTAMAPPFFTNEAMSLIDTLGVEHLLVDIPSLDRQYDEGKLTAHHLYWGVPAGSHEVEPGMASCKTVTELIYVPDDVRDGCYLLNLQIADFTSDAAPSRPVLFPLIDAEHEPVG